MDIHELREELITYIHLADEKKLQALQTLLLDGKEDEEEQWWKNEVLVAEMDEDVRKIESGEEPSFTEEEVYAAIHERLEKRKTAHV